MKDKRAFCKNRVFTQEQGIRKILPQAYDLYSEDKILSITQILRERTLLQVAQKVEYNRFRRAVETGVAER